MLVSLDIRRLRRRIWREARRELAAAGLSPGAKVSIIAAPTAASLVTVHVVASIEREYCADIRVLALGGDKAVNFVAGRLGLRVHFVEEGEVTPLDVLLLALRERMSRRNPVTPLTSDDLALLALTDALSPPPVAALLEALARPVHPLGKILASEARAYAKLIYPGSEELRSTLAEGHYLSRLVHATTPHALRSLHSTLARVLASGITRDPGQPTGVES